MIPLAVPNLTGNENRYLQECIETGFVSSVGPFVSRMEQMVSTSCGAPYSVATASGTTGLHVALTALGVKRDDLVILPTFTFIGSANAIAHCGAEPWLMDVSSQSWTLDVEQLESSLKSKTDRQGDQIIHKESGRRVAAIMPVHVLGMPADMDPIVSIAREYNLPVLADAACALGATYKERKIANVKADISVFSFNGNKTVTAGGGGIVTGSNRELLDRVHHLTTTAKVGPDYDFDEVGFNYRMTNLQAAVGCAQLERLDEFVATKRRIQARYFEALAQNSQVSFFPEPSYAASSCWLAGFVLNEKSHLSVSEIQTRMADAGIQARSFWKPIHLQKPYSNSPVEVTTVTDSFWSRVVTLPCSTSLEVEQQEFVISTLQDILT